MKFPSDSRSDHPLSQGHQEFPSSGIASTGRAAGLELQQHQQPGRFDLYDVVHYRAQRWRLRGARFWGFASGILISGCFWFGYWASRSNDGGYFIIASTLFLVAFFMQCYVGGLTREYIDYYKIDHTERQRKAPAGDNETAAPAGVFTHSIHINGRGRV